MIHFEFIHEIELFGIADAAIPDKERIILRALEDCNLQQFFIALGSTEGTDIGIIPYRNYSFFFSELIVHPGDWIVIYTGKGIFQSTRMPVTHERAYSLHWNSENVFFSHPHVVPVIYRLSGIQYSPLGFRDAGLSLREGATPRLSEPPDSHPPTPLVGE